MLGVQDIDASDYARDGEEPATMPKDVADQMVMDQVKAFNEKAEVQASTIDEGSSYVTPGMQDVFDTAKDKTTAAVSGAAAAVSDALGGPTTAHAVSSSGETLQKVKEGISSIAQKAGETIKSGRGGSSSDSGTPTAGNDNARV